MERFLRNILLLVLLLSMLLLLGSGRNANLPVERSEAELTADSLGELIPKGERSQWHTASLQRPLWLLHVTSSPLPRQ